MYFLNHFHVFFKVLLAPKIKKYKISNNKNPKSFIKTFIPKQQKNNKKIIITKLKPNPTPKAKEPKDVF
ncbi:hypothetical protein QN326_02440 [Candidatus Phytoplasma asteris]|uniref:Uncharacterized protein n=1 Tax=Candidatus Phytoplasma asteris TaxID=85620 RepID=A0ABZ3CCM7_9MOLU